MAVKHALTPMHRQGGGGVNASSRTNVGNAKNENENSNSIVHKIQTII